MLYTLSHPVPFPESVSSFTLPHLVPEKYLNSFTREERIENYLI
jgi:hypothetical protein